MAGEPETPGVPGSPVPPPAEATAPAPAAQAAARSRWQRREQAAADALRTFIRDLHEARFGAVAPRTPTVDLDLRLRLTPGSSWSLVFDPPLAEQIQPQLEAAHARLAVYSEGHAFCHKCESAACEHAVPPTPATVFTGYDPMGVPEWKEFTQVLIERKDERVGDLYSPRAPFVCVLQMGRDLKARQLGTFGRGSKSYCILGQVAAGYLGVRLPTPAGAVERCAFTFQVVEGRDAAGRLSLKLNTLAAPPAGMTLDELLASEAGDWVGRAREAAVRAVSHIERIARESRGSEGIRMALGRVPLVLRRLAETLERGRRLEDRRTRHARVRHEDRRPVYKALEDVGAARAGQVFVDERQDTLVVCGPQGRAHVFNRAGRHVTSFTLPPGGAESRVRMRRWVPAGEGDVASLKANAVRPADPAPAERRDLDTVRPPPETEPTHDSTKEAPAR